MPVINVNDPCSLQDKYNESEAKLNRAMSVVQTYQQRLAFACSRLQMLQGQFARKEARLRLMTEELPTRDIVPKQDDG